MYKMVIYDTPLSRHIEKHTCGRPAKHRGKKKKATPEDIQRNNERRAARKLNLKICANFRPGDYHLVLTYKREMRLPEEAAKKELARFFRGLREDYRKVGHELKYIATTEYKSVAIHHHVILNRIPGGEEMVRRRWGRGRPRFTQLDDTGDYIQLAEYFLKETKRSREKGERKGQQAYTCSRNLVMPKKKERHIRAKDFRQPRIPDGYEMLKGSFEDYITPTGYRHQYYTLIKTRRMRN